jgi:hypothetical protein
MSDAMPIPEDLPTVIAMGYSVEKGKALYLQDNNMSVKARRFVSDE